MTPGTRQGFRFWSIKFVWWLVVLVCAVVIQVLLGLSTASPGSLSHLQTRKVNSTSIRNNIGIQVRCPQLSIPVVLALAISNLVIRIRALIAGCMPLLNLILLDLLSPAKSCSAPPSASFSMSSSSLSSSSSSFLSSSAFAASSFS